MKERRERKAGLGWRWRWGGRMEAEPRVSPSPLSPCEGVCRRRCLFSCCCCIVPRRRRHTDTEALATARLLFRPPINVNQGALWPTDAGLVGPPIHPHAPLILIHHHHHPYIHPSGGEGWWWWWGSTSVADSDPETTFHCVAVGEWGGVKEAGGGGGSEQKEENQHHTDWLQEKEPADGMAFSALSISGAYCLMLPLSLSRSLPLPSLSWALCYVTAS